MGLQVTTRSPVGALVYGCDTIVIGEGRLAARARLWLRADEARDLQFQPRQNLYKVGQVPSYLLVADDVLGGFFAINGGAFDGKAGNVFYFALDSGEWEDTQLSYSRFFTGRFAAIYLNFTSFTAGTVGGEDVRKISLDKANFVRYSGMPA